MTNYNFTNLTNASITTNPGDLVCQFNILLDHWFAMSLVIVIGLIIFILLSKLNYSIYTTMVLVTFTTTILSSLLWVWTCNGTAMISTVFMVSNWLLFAISALIRKMVND